MFEVVYHTALKCYTKKSDGVEQKRVHFTRRAFLATKPSVGELVSAALFKKEEPTRFVVVKIEHCTHLSPPQALSYVPEFLGELTLGIDEASFDTGTGLSYILNEQPEEVWEQLIADVVSLGWEVKK